MGPGNWAEIWLTHLRLEIIKWIWPCASQQEADGIIGIPESGIPLLENAHPEKLSNLKFKTKQVFLIYQHSPELKIKVELAAF